MTIQGTYGLCPNQFWDQAGLPSADACNERPDQFKRKVLDPADIVWAAEVTTFGGTHFDSLVVTAATTGTITLTTPGVLLVDSAATAADLGVCVQTKNPWLAVTAGKKYGVLSCYKVTDTLIGAQYFNGLMEIVTATHGSGVFVSKDYVGYGADATTIASDSDGCFFVRDSADSGTEATTNIGTLVEDTYAWVGFVVDGISSARVWLNGVWYATTIATKMPAAATALYPTFACLCEPTTSDPILAVSHFEARWEVDTGI